MQTTITMLLVATVFAAIGFLMAWAADKSQSYWMFRISRALSRFGYFLASVTVALLPFGLGLLQPNHANEPIIAIGLIGSMFVAYHATKSSIRWHEQRRSSQK